VPKPASPPAQLTAPAPVKASPKVSYAQAMAFFYGDGKVPAGLPDDGPEDSDG
jgi:hypothetical protein